MDRLSSSRVSTIDYDTHQRFYYEITNESSEPKYVDDYLLYEADSLSSLGLDEADCTVFRTGRHKNDMPSVFRLGENSASLADALSGMTETGDKKSADENSRVIVSDHLTVLGSEKKYLVISYPEGRSQLFETDIEIDENANFTRLVCKVHFGIVVAPGETVRTEPIDFEYTTDVMGAIDRFASEKASLYGARCGKKPSVFCTWYYYGLTVTLEDVLTNLQIMKDRGLPFDVFQVDEGWEVTLGEWEPNGKFPIDMKELASKIKEAGFVPGIWTSPFVAHQTATVWKNHPEWILKDKCGEPCLFHMNDTVYQVFDITNPATWDYFRELFHKLTFDWGYTYHKLDFTRAAVIYDNAVYYDESITLVEAYYSAVKAIREGMGEESYFLMCGGLYDPIIGLVDAQRTGSDVLSMWSSNINKDGKTAPYTMKQSMLRYYMNRWWDNDPDALMVRKNGTMERGLRLTYGLLTDDEVRTSAINQYMGGGIVCSTEPLDKISDDRLSNIQKIIPSIPRNCHPIDIMDAKERFPEKIKIEIDDSVASIVRINWSDTEDMQIKIILNEALLPAGASADDSYVVADYYGGVFRCNVHAGDEIELPALRPHAATVIKVEKMSDKPIVVRSTGHFSMGRENIILSAENGKTHIKYANRFDFPVSYSILNPATGRVADVSIEAKESVDLEMEI